MRTSIYVDGFNLYFGALKGTPYKWLDIPALCRHKLGPQNCKWATRTEQARNTRSYLKAHRK